MAIICMACITNVSAQKAKTPMAAEKAFQQKFPKAKEVTWEKEGKAEYEATFIQDGKKGSANFSPAGEWLETEMAISLAAAPKTVIDGFNKAFSGAVITEIFKIESKTGKNYFEIEYSVKGKKKEVKLNTDGKPL